MIFVFLAWAGVAAYRAKDIQTLTHRDDDLLLKNDPVKFALN